jgi:hypothetical protein
MLEMDKSPKTVRPIDTSNTKRGVDVLEVLPFAILLFYSNLTYIGSEKRKLGHGDYSPE